MILEQINSPKDVKKLKPEELTVLAEEIRTFLIDKISCTGGHLVSNLGKPLKPPYWRSSSKASFLPLKILWV